MRFPGDDKHHTWWTDKATAICDVQSREERIRLISLFTLANGVAAAEKLKRMIKAEWERRRLEA